MKKYDYLLVGSGLFAGVFAWHARKEGKTCLVLEKRPHAGGNIYCEEIEGINVHKYGAHFPYQQPGGLGFRQQPGGVQPLYQQPGGQL